MKKRSFFERLAGSTDMPEEYDAFEDDAPQPAARKVAPTSSPSRETRIRPQASAPVHEEGEGQLPVDVYQSATEIVIRAFVAGVRPDEMNVSISRDMVVIEGAREEREQVTDSDYFIRELFWGSFSRTILLPQEVDVDNSAASAKDGLLTIVLPKLDRARQTKLRVKMG